MPDINLLHDTKQPETARPKPPVTGEIPLSTPIEEPKGLSKFLKRFTGRVPKESIPTSPIANPTLRRNRPTERILDDKTKGAPAMIPLPDQDDMSVNLLGDDLTNKVNPTQRLIQLGLIAAGVAVIIALLAFGLSYYRRTIDADIEATKKEDAQVQSQIAKLQLQSGAITQVTTRVAAIQSLLDQHIRWTKFFDRLEHYTIRQVTYGAAFSSTVQPTITFSATTDSYEHLAEQYLILKQAVATGDFISSFTITAAARTVKNKVETVQFNLLLNLVPSVFVGQGDDTSINTGDAQAMIRRSLTCYLANQPDAISKFPVNYRQTFQPTAAAIQTAKCDTLTTADLAQAQTLVQTDADQDGLVLYLEQYFNTADQKIDTDNDGTTDLAEVLACTDPNGSGDLTNCTPTP